MNNNNFFKKFKKEGFKKINDVNILKQYCDNFLYELNKAECTIKHQKEKLNKYEDVEEALKSLNSEEVPDFADDDCDNVF